MALVHLPAWLSAWLKTRAQRAELQSLPESELRRIEEETGLTDYDIAHLKADNPAPGSLMPHRLAAAGIDPKYLRETQPAVYRDLERTCMRCGSTKQCAHDLAAGDWQAGQDGYCANASTIDALLTKR